MSLICETIVSEDEMSSQTQTNRTEDEELDYEEEDMDRPKDEPQDDRDEGELDDDDDLEEGEVKEDEDDDRMAHKRVTPPDGQQPPEGQTRQTATSICRFYGRGQCTWGNNCRFVHPTGGMPAKRMPPLPPPLPLPLPPPHMATHHAPPPPQQRAPRRDFYAPESAGGAESAWERGLKQAKEMIVRASRRKEEEVDFEDKRFNLSVEETTSGGRDRSPVVVDRYGDDEYERRRRLAFESAPWNNEEPVGAKARSAETYRDPWRRSKSPKGRRPAVASKRSSMSSISDSDSESSFGSSSEFSSSSQRSRKRFNRRSAEKQKKKTPSAGPTTQAPPNWNNPTKPEERAYDSWSESLSDSESMTSYYSGSESDSADAEHDRSKRIPKRSQPKNKTAADGAPAAKKARPAPSGGQQASPRAERPKKSPIKMTFLRKQQNLRQKDASVDRKLNGTEGQQHVTSADLHIPDPQDDKKSVSSASPVSHEAQTPPPPTTGSSSGSASSRHEKSLSATVSRREELLQQLKAVEDAIARKRSKIN